MKLDEILLASGNDHKVREFRRLFPGVRVLVPRDLGIDFDFEENGETFLDNALGKARALYAEAGRPVIADDSGLCVEALGGAPGVRSARFGAGPDGRPIDQSRKNALLLERLAGSRERAAYFVCCLALVLDKARFFVAQETVRGSIADEPRGVHGFGYDPLFALPGRPETLAEVPDEEKDALSHRGRAARRMLALMAAGG